ncbi:hypothetical protein GWN26_14420 [Candidatus Saccharibacteria bacterium]|nr:hypothetical protein [Candidatus Saccharibacteria bacterium]NIV04434.1 hypothetical protein [Calditrichia bacterium]NIS38971.1 hypothetical protein [Candidatus Saccharibacteria bacterium]NIV72985.1 hypothetical protein [Calditrichia bacterium]NIW00242.1 hypothetical protein [Candidatus Saccharibacteria bacterium]
MNSQYRKLSKGEKWSLFILSAATLSIVVLGAWQMRSTIFAPFERQPSGELREQLDPTKNIEELRNQDTDQDGLSDFDELYVHATSPYLPDSDSDGITDSAEIEAGKDPNCPEGQDCYFVQGGTTAEEIGEEVDLTEQEKAELILQLPTEQLRELLLEAGVPGETLEQLSDEELKEMIGNILSEESGVSPGATSTQE